MKKGILFILIACCTFSLCTILDGHGWEDDFAMYILHAKNITLGIPYSETGYIYNPLAPTYAPQNYPSGFPLLIAPIYKAFGLNFIAYKIEILFFFLLFLFLMYKFFEKKINTLYVIALLFVFAFSTFFWAFRNEILSDIPAAVFILLSLWVYEKATATNSTRFYIILGVTILIATIIRTTGISVLVSLLIFELIKNKKLKKGILISSFISVFLLIIVNALLEIDNSYLSITLEQYSQMSFGEIVNSILVKMNKYMLSFKNFTISNQFDNLIFTLFFYFSFSVSMIGYLFKVWKAFTIAELFIFFYTGMVLLWPEYQGIRFFIPILPFYLYYFFYLLGKMKSKIFSRAILASYILITMFIYVQFYINIPKGTTPYGVQELYNLETFEFIKYNTPDSTLFMSSKPRAFTLFTERNGIVFPDKGNADLLLQNLKTYHVDFVITGSIDYWKYIKETIPSDTLHFTKMFDNNSFQIYKTKNL